MNLSELNPNPKNPRTITPEKLAQLKSALEEFGDLGGFVYNRKTKQLVGGHQRAKIFDKYKIQIEKEYKKPTKTGTVAEGYVFLNEDRFSYREVSWDAVKEKAANIAANKGAGEWDLPELGTWLKEIGDFGFNLDLTMFSDFERADLMFTSTPNFNPGSESDQGKLDEIDPVILTCPHCQKSFDARA